MNEKIYKLAANVGIIKEENGYFWIQSTDELEKFAELIVRECVQQLELVRKYRYDRVQPLENQQTIINECQYQIKQHFGVE